MFLLFLTPMKQLTLPGNALRGFLVAKIFRHVANLRRVYVGMLNAVLADCQVV